VVVALSAVTATLIAAGIGATAGIIGGLAGQFVAGRLDRQDKRDARQLDDLISRQDVLARLNRLHHRVARYWRHDEDSRRVPDELWEDFAATRAEALALNERVVKEPLRQAMQGLRQMYCVQLRPEFVDVERERLDEQYTSVQERSGEAIRQRLG